MLKNELFPAVNASILYYLTDLSSILHVLTGRTFTIKFSHSIQSYYESGNETRLLDLSFYRSSLCSKEYAEFISSLLLNASVSGNRSSQLAVLTSIDNAIVIDTLATNTTDFQVGGGFGAGMQIYCDDSLIITAGVGGGGGVFDSGDEVGFTFGGGGGGGLQLSDNFGTGTDDDLAAASDASFRSFGGGGGCGTISPHNVVNGSSRDIFSSPFSAANSKVTGVVCGSARDADSGTDAELRSLLTSRYTPEAFRPQHCKRITVYGGGGGGGGGSSSMRTPGSEMAGDRDADAASTAAGVGFGYGFHFKLWSDSELSDENIDDIGSRNDSNSIANDQSLVYDALSAVLSSATAKCNGYSSWACICAEVRNAVDNCLLTRSKSQGDELTNSGSSAAREETSFCAEIFANRDIFLPKLDSMCWNGVNGTNANNSANDSATDINAVVRPIFAMYINNGSRELEFSASTNSDDDVSFTEYVVSRYIGVSGVVVKHLTAGAPTTPPTEMLLLQAEYVQLSDAPVSDLLASFCAATVMVTLLLLVVKLVFKRPPIVRS